MTRKTSEEHLLDARQEVIDINWEIETHERELEQLTERKASAIQALRGICSHERVVEVREEGANEAFAWEIRKRFCLDCGDREDLRDQGKAGWPFERLKGEPLRVFTAQRHLEFLERELHQECRLGIGKEIMELH